MCFLDSHTSVKSCFHFLISLAIFTNYLHFKRDRSSVWINLKNPSQGCFVQSFVEISLMVMERRRKNKKVLRWSDGRRMQERDCLGSLTRWVKAKMKDMYLKVCVDVRKASSVSRQFVINRPGFLVVVFAWLFVFYESNDGIFEWNIESNFYDGRPIWNIV